MNSVNTFAPLYIIFNRCNGLIDQKNFKDRYFVVELTQNFL